MPRSPRLTLKDDDPQSNLLVVEGADDFHTFISLLDAHKMRGQCRLEDGGGYEAMRESMDTRIDESGLERIGFVVDADEDISSRWASLRDMLTTRCGYIDVPEAPVAGGTIIRQNDKVIVGFWLMPDNTLPGALEEFIRLLIPAGNPNWDYAVSTVDGLPNKPAPLDSNWISKARVHSWLAWQEEPGKPIGQAITKRYLDPKAEQAQQIVQWITRLFSL